MGFLKKKEKVTTVYDFGKVYFERNLNEGLLYFFHVKFSPTQ